jgi:hypothetical protein
VETTKGDMFTQYGCLNFHAKTDGGPKLILAIKNKWSMGWMRSWFYCRVPFLQSSESRKSVYTLHSLMSALDYTVEPEVECPKGDANDAAIVLATTIIRGQDNVEEFMASRMYPLTSSFGFSDMTIGMMPVSKV